MKLKILLLLLSGQLFFTSFSQDTNIAFAITGQAGNNFNWSDIRVLDMKSGNLNATLYENGISKFSFLDAETGRLPQLNFNAASISNLNKNIAGTVNNVVIHNGKMSPTSLMSAAVGYDKIHNKLFFATMRTGQLIWLDLRSNSSTPSFFTIQQPLINNNDFSNEALNITRMAIGADGNGYALTNDGNHLIQFTTGSKTIIKDLGSLIDDDTNQGISVHNPCSSWGGDIVADAFGKLYLFSANHSVFIIDPETRITTYKGSVSNLTGTFSINGAAVIDDNSVLVSSANTFEGYYKVDINTLAALKIKTTSKIYNASDLASCNLLHQQEFDNNMNHPQINNAEVIGNRFISIYPNPAINNQVKITFDVTASGKYKISLFDLQGRLIGIKEVYVEGPGQVVNFQMRNKEASGLYIIQITDTSGKAIFSDKLIIE